MRRTRPESRLSRRQNRNPWRRKRKQTAAARIADQLRRAFDGSAWHGPALLELLQDVDAATAAASRWRRFTASGNLCCILRCGTTPGCGGWMGKNRSRRGRTNFPLLAKPTEAAWRKTIAETKRTHETLVKTVAALPDSRLGDRVPGKRYDFYHLLHGIAQHELYHAGQIAILKKAGKG